MTFDDGPDGDITPAIIHILDKYPVKGSFFFLGSEVEAYPEVVKNAYNKGNLILSHSYNHVDLTTLSKEEIRLKIDSSWKNSQVGDQKNQPFSARHMEKRMTRLLPSLNKKAIPSFCGPLTHSTRHKRSIAIL